MSNRSFVAGEALRHGIKKILSEADAKEDLGMEEMGIEDINSIHHGNDARKELINQTSHFGFSDNSGNVDEAYVRNVYQPIIDQINSKYGINMVIDLININIIDPTIFDQGTVTINVNVSGGEHIEPVSIQIGYINTNGGILQEYVDNRAQYIADNLSLSDCKTSDDVLNKISQIPNNIPGAENITEVLVSNFTIVPATAVADGTVRTNIEVHTKDSSYHSTTHVVEDIIYSNTQGVADLVATQVLNNTTWECYEKSEMTRVLQDSLNRSMASMPEQGLTSSNCKVSLNQYQLNVTNGTIQYGCTVTITRNDGQVVTSSKSTTPAFSAQALANAIYNNIVSLQMMMCTGIFTSNANGNMYIVNDTVVPDCNFNIKDTSAYGTDQIVVSCTNSTVSGSTAILTFSIRIGSLGSYSFTYNKEF